MVTTILWSRSLVIVTAVTNIGYDDDHHHHIMMKVIIIIIIRMMTKKTNDDQFITHCDKPDKMMKIVRCRW